LASARSSVDRATAF